jgi:hypothetical protein
MLAPNLPAPTEQPKPRLPEPSWWDEARFDSLDLLRRDGIVQIGKVVPVADIATALQDEETKPGHVWRPTDQNSPDVCCYSFKQVLRIPGFLTYALSLTEFVRAYLETDPVMYSVNAYWSKPAEKTHPALQELHRDKDDNRFLTLFIYGTDVLCLDDGPHQYLMGTQHGAENGQHVSVYGWRMYGFLADGRGLHRGLMPRSGPRLLAWVRWGISDPPATYLSDGAEPVPKRFVQEYPFDPYLQHMIRLVAN